MVVAVEAAVECEVAMVVVVAIVVVMMVMVVSGLGGGERRSAISVDRWDIWLTTVVLRSIVQFVGLKGITRTDAQATQEARRASTLLGTSTPTSTQTSLLITMTRDQRATSTKFYDAFV